jgi:hypothetical protein
MNSGRLVFGLWSWVFGLDSAKGACLGISFLLQMKNEKWQMRNDKSLAQMIEDQGTNPKVRVERSY